MTAAGDADDAEPTRSLAPPDPSRPVLPAPRVRVSELPPPILSSRQLDAGSASSSTAAPADGPPPAPDHGATPAPVADATPVSDDDGAPATDEIAIVAGAPAGVNRTTILRGPGVTGLGPGERRLVRGSDIDPRPGDVLAATPSASSLPDRATTSGGASGDLSSLALDRRTPPPPPPASPFAEAPVRPVRGDAGHERAEHGQVASGNQPTVRPITVPDRRGQSFPARSIGDKPFATHAPPVRIRRARRRSGIGVVVTLLVLGGIIAAAVVFGRPILFPDGWSPEARPYGEAVEASLAFEFDERPEISRVPTDVHRLGMLDRFGGEWQDDLPLWRSLGLASSDIDASTLAGLLADWQPAYVDVDASTVVVDEAASDVDAHITTAMAVAALDQRLDWNARRAGAGLELRVLIDAHVRALAREVSATTSFGAADDSRPLSSATFLPPVLAYRIHGPLAFGDLVPAAAAGAVTAPEAIAPMSELGAAPSAQLVGGEVVDATHATDRAFWYLVFAGRVDARRAYDASNGLSLVTLTTTRQGDLTCAAATFSGADPDRTAALSSVLDDWVASAPVEMSATLTVRGDGVLQLRTCDPGVGFVNDSRFGVARELVRWRLVELAARERAIELGVNADAAVAEVRRGTAAEALLGGDFEMAPEAERAAARRIAEALLDG